MAKDPAKEKKQKLLAIGLVSLLIPLLIWNGIRHKRRTAGPKGVEKTAISQNIPTPVSGAISSFPASGSGEGVSELEAYEKTLSWKRDPFLLQLGREEPTLALKVSGIIYDEVHPEATYAIINEEVVRIGDDVRGIKVVDIQADHVRLKKFSQQLILYLHAE